MSAYAISFPSLPPLLLTNVNSPSMSRQEDEKDKQQNEITKKLNMKDNETKSEDYLLNTALHVSVKSANIDPLALVGNYLSNRPIPRRIKQWRNRNKSRLSSMSHSYSNEEKSSSNDFEYEAVQFQLSISLNGRKYSATRTLRRFAQLRHDLVKELNEDRRTLKTSKPQSCRNRATIDNQSDNSDNINSSKDNVTRETVEDDCSSLLPELPSMCNKNGRINDTDNISCGGLSTHLTHISSSGISMAKAAAASVLPIGFASRSFTALQNSLIYYCPLIECWLKCITDVVNPDVSPSFSKFLWEPLNEYYTSVPNLYSGMRCNEEDCNYFSEKGFTHHPMKKKTLSSIMEDECEH